MTMVIYGAPSFCISFSESKTKVFYYMVMVPHWLKIAIQTLHDTENRRTG